MNLATKYYMEKKRAHDEFIEKERAEFELGKRHLANMMGDKGRGTYDILFLFLDPSLPCQHLATDLHHKIHTTFVV